MAIIPELPGLSTNICVGGVSLQEYDCDEVEVQERGPKIPTVVKYVESVEGQEFFIGWKLNAPYTMDVPSLTLRIQVDGTRMYKILASRSKYDRVGSFKARWSGPLIGTPGGIGILRPLKFSKIETSLNDDALAKVEEDAKLLARSGEIVLEVHKGGDIIRRLKTGKPSSLNLNEKVHEKAMKGEPKYHGTSLGDGKPATMPNFGKKAAFIEDNPFARFVFKYRSREGLKQLLVIPRTPEPESPPAIQEPQSLNLEGLNQEQLSEVQELVRSLKGQSSGSSMKEEKIKRERQDDIAGPSKRPKMETETIDLTEDD